MMSCDFCVMSCGFRVMACDFFKSTVLVIGRLPPVDAAHIQRQADQSEQGGGASGGGGSGDGVHAQLSRQ